MGRKAAVETVRFGVLGKKTVVPVAVKAASLDVHEVDMSSPMNKIFTFGVSYRIQF